MKHSRRHYLRRGVISVLEVIIVMAAMLGTMVLVGWVATMANAWVATL